MAPLTCHRQPDTLMVSSTHGFAPGRKPGPIWIIRRKNQSPGRFEPLLQSHPECLPRPRVPSGRPRLHFFRTRDPRCLGIWISVLTGRDDAPMPERPGEWARERSFHELCSWLDAPLRPTAAEEAGAREGKAAVYEGVAQRYREWWRENALHIRWNKKKGHFFLKR